MTGIARLPMLAHMRIHFAFLPVLVLCGLLLAGAPAIALVEPAQFAPEAPAGPPEGLPTPDDLVREALRHPPTDPKKRAEVLTGLYDRLAAAPSPDEGKVIAHALEQVWRTSGSPTMDLLLARATAALEAKRFEIAFPLLDTILELQPDFVEGWNRRAYAFYLRDENRRALADIQHVLALDPRHFRALEGMGLIMRAVGEKKAALAAYRKLLEVYPHHEGAKKAIEELTIEVEGQGI